MNSLSNPFNKQILIYPELMKLQMKYAPIENQLTRCQAEIFNITWYWRYSQKNLDKFKNSKWDLIADIKTLSEYLNMTIKTVDNQMGKITNKSWWKRAHRYIQFNDELMELSINNAKNKGVNLYEKSITKRKIYRDDKKLEDLIGVKRDV